MNLFINRGGSHGNHTVIQAVIDLNSTKKLYQPLVSMVYRLNDHKAIQHVYIDLSKAFDSLDHSILLHKLEYYGICNIEYRLLHS